MYVPAGQTGFPRLTTSSLTIRGSKYYFRRIRTTTIAELPVLLFNANVTSAVVPPFKSPAPPGVLMQHFSPAEVPHNMRAALDHNQSINSADQFAVLIADAHAVVREGMRRILEVEAGMRVVATIATPEAVVELVQRRRPDLLLVDSSIFLSMHVLQQVSAIASTAVVLFTERLRRDEALFAVRLGVRGIVGKDTPVASVVQCIRRVLAGEHWIERELLAEAVRVPSSESNRFDLSDRELEIIGNIVSGACNKEIAQRLGISDLTVKRHLTNVYNKVGVTGRLELALFALANNLAHNRNLISAVASPTSGKPVLRDSAWPS